VPTPGEKKALLFLSLVAVLGAGTRLVSANQLPAPTEEEARALDAQLRAVDSVGRTSGRGRPRGQRERRAGRGRKPAGADTARRGAGNDTQHSAPATPYSPPATPYGPPTIHYRQPTTRLDVDRASAAQLESLPGIGPALARRIVATRDSSGTFGSLAALQSRVRGIGPALAKRLAPDVTFSAPYSPPSAERTEPFGNGANPERVNRRRH
jgi:hypothetical protein